MSMDILGLTTVQEMREAHHLKSPKGISIDAGGGGGLIQNSSGVSMEIPATPFTPKTNTKSELGPYPTTFVQADTSNFKQIVQMLTGSSETVTKQHQQSSKSLIPPIRAPPKRIHMQQHQGFKLYERRNQYSHQLKNNALIINTLIPGLAGTGAGDFSPRNKAEILSPSTLDFPKLALSPVTPLLDPFNNPSSSPYSICSTSTPSSEEERAIAEKGFYLHPSPISTPGGAEPQLLPLFPVTSPRASEFAQSNPGVAGIFMSHFHAFLSSHMKGYHTRTLSTKNEKWTAPSKLLGTRHKREDKNWSMCRGINCSLLSVSH